MDATPRPKPEIVTPPDDLDEDFDADADDSLLFDTSDEDFPSLSSASPAGKGADPELDQYKQERAAARRRRIGIGIVIALATITVPFAYLFLSGDLRGIRHRQVPVALTVATDAKHSVVNAKAAHPGPLTAEQKHQAVVAADLHDYLWNGIAKLTPIEQPILKAYESATGKQYAGDAKSFEIIRTQVVPPYVDFVRQAAELKPKTSEVGSLQALFLNSIELRLLAYKHIAEAEHAKDNTWRLTVGAELQASATASDRFKSAALDMAQHYEVPLPNQ